MHGMTTHAAWRLTELASGYWRSAAIGAAAQLGIFDQVTDPRPADAVAEALGLDPAYTADLLAALAAMGLLTGHGDGYVLHDGARPLLDPASSQCMLPALRLNGDLYRLWGRLAECVRDGKAAIPAGAHLGGDEAQTRRFVLGMHSRATALGPAIVAGVDLTDCRSLLDVGSGPGTLGRMLAGLWPDVTVTQLDLPGVLDVAQELTEGDPAAGRIRFHPADYRRDALPGGFDAVLYCGALHQETAASARGVLAALGDAAQPGGRVVVIDFMRPGAPDPTNTAARHAPHADFPALFALQMKLFDPGAGVFGVDEVRAMLASAGLTHIQARRLEPTAYQLVEARRSPPSTTEPPSCDR